jgi:lysophospholipid acyltransferase (LPLAT)-like uncharacterized protein
MKEGWLNRFLLLLIPSFVAWVMKIWFATCTIKVRNEQHSFPPDTSEENTVVASFYHYSLPFIFFYFRKYSATAMVSASKDGDYIACLAERLGFKTIRGSKNRKGVEALKSMLRAIKNGETCAIVADGSQGPPKIVQPGAIFLASRGGVPILPIAWSASHHFKIRSWDRTAIPKPFSTIFLYFGEPLSVPAKVRPEEIDEYRDRLQDRLDKINAEAWTEVGKKTH